MRERIVEILETVKPGAAFTSCKAIIDDGLLESFDIIRLVSLLCDEFDVEITAAELIPENFNSVDAIEAMIKELED